jgi:hypothetical protein
MSRRDIPEGPLFCVEHPEQERRKKETVFKAVVTGEIAVGKGDGI